MKNPEEITDPRVIKALGHPLRMRILALLDGRTASPKELAEELGEPLGNVSYHVRTLADLGFIELVRKKPRRGAIEHFYRAESKHIVSDEDWVNLPGPAKRALVQTKLTQIGKDIQAAAAAGGFDHRQAFTAHAVHQLDDQGCQELSKAVASFLKEMEGIEKESRKRLGKTEATHRIGSVTLIFEAAGDA